MTRLCEGTGENRRGSVTGPWQGRSLPRSDLRDMGYPVPCHPSDVSPVAAMRRRLADARWLSALPRSCSAIAPLRSAARDQLHAPQAPPPRRGAVRRPAPAGRASCRRRGGGWRRARRRTCAGWRWWGRRSARESGSARIAREDRAGARGGGDQGAGPGAEAKAELEHVPALLRLLPLGELVAPGEMMFGAAQDFGAGAGEERGRGAGAEGEPAQARLPVGHPGVGDVQEARCAPRP